MALKVATLCFKLQFGQTIATGTICGYQPRDCAEDQHIGRVGLNAPHPVIRWDDLDDPTPEAFKEVCVPHPFGLFARQSVTVCPPRRVELVGVIGVAFRRKS